MKILFIIFVFFFFLEGINGQVENTGAKNENPAGSFFYDYLNFKSDETGQTRVDVYIQVPYTEVQFVKSETGFSGGYRVTVSVFDEDKEKLIVEKMWNEKIETENFDQTNSSKNFNLSRRSFNLIPGDYVFRTAVEDRDSRKTNVSESSFKVRDLSDDVSVSDVMMIASKSVVNGSNKILPNVSKNVMNQKEGIPLFYEIYSDTTIPIKIDYSILDDKKEVIFKKTDGREISKGNNQIFYTIIDSTISLGNYIISVSIKNIKNNNLAEVNKSFISRWIGFPVIVKNLEEAVEQLTYIASSEEIDYIENGETEEEKINRYLDFWKKKDPSPSTEENQVFNEYYRRVAYANANFSHYVDGWKTDRGMVFIILGAPNNVDRHPFDYNSKPYEVWEYYELNKQFVFVDQTGFGDYRLITPLYGDFYRYRY